MAAHRPPHRPARRAAQRRQGLRRSDTIAGLPMTRQMSATAINAVAEDELARLVLAFGFMKSSAERLGIAHADQWQLDYLENGVAPWRIVDHGAAAGESGRNVAIA